MMATSGIQAADQTALVHLLQAATAEAKLRAGDGLASTDPHPSPAMPVIHVTLEAARRYRGYENAIARLMLAGMEAVALLGAHVREVVLTARAPWEEDEVADGIHIDLTVGYVEQRAALWERLAEIEWVLPFEVWFTLS